MPFIQIIEFTTSRPDQVEALVDEWRAKTRARRTAQRGTFTQDRDRRDVYVQIVESLAARRLRPTLTCPRRPKSPQRLAQLCNGPIQFRNLDVRRVEEMQRPTRKRKEQIMSGLVRKSLDSPE